MTVTDGRYELPAEHAEVLLDEESLLYAAPLARFATSIPLSEIIEAYRTGGGVPWSAYGADGREAQAALNRPLFAKLLTQEWLPAIPDVHERLQQPGARVAELACGEYDFVCVFEAIHDLARPVEALAAMRRLGGAAIVMDERTGDPEHDRLLYGFSLFCCLPTGMSETPSAATGTVMRPETMRRYAREAGFGDAVVLDNEHEAFRFYRLN